MRIEQFTLSISSIAVVLFSLSVFAETNKCETCKGKKIIEVWSECPECNGSRKVENGTQTIVCKKCANSVRKGKVRTKKPCPKCIQPKQCSVITPIEYKFMRKKYHDEVRREIQREQLKSNE